MSEVNEPVNPPRDEKQKEIDLFLVLEGGGARGIAHVAAWDVLDGLVSKPGRVVNDLPNDLGEDRFVLRGVAGSSAGAVVASFIAAGAKAEDLVDSDGRVPLCEPLGFDYFYDIFGVREWRRLKFLRRLQGPSGLLAHDLRRLRHELEGQTSNLRRGSFIKRVCVEIGALAVLVLAFFAIRHFWFGGRLLLEHRGVEAAFLFVSYVVTRFVFHKFVARAAARKKPRFGPINFIYFEMVALILFGSVFFSILYFLLDGNPMFEERGADLPLQSSSTWS